MIRYTITLPNFDNDGQDTDIAREYVAHRLLKRFGGYTETQVRGAYTMPNGDVVHDASTRFEVLTDRPAARAFFRLLAQGFAVEASQDSVLVTEEPVTANFYRVD